MADQLEDMDEELKRAGSTGPKDPDADGVGADGIDIYKYRRRWRLGKAVLLGGVLAIIVGIVWSMLDGKVNPCERVRDYLCKKDPKSLNCKSYEGIVDESVHEASAEMRSNIKAQCVSKIERLKEDEGVDLMK